MTDEDLQAALAYQLERHEQLMRAVEMVLAEARVVHKTCEALLVMWNARRAAAAAVMEN
jgi:hypothetical protein